MLQWAQAQRRGVSLLLGLCALCGVPCYSVLTRERFPSFYSSRGELTVQGEKDKEEERIHRGEGGILTRGSPCYKNPARDPCVPGTPLSRVVKSSIRGPVAKPCRGFGVPANASTLTGSKSRMGEVFRPVRPSLLSLALGVRRAWLLVSDGSGVRWRIIRLRSVAAESFRLSVTVPRAPSYPNEGRSSVGRLLPSKTV